MPEEMTEPKTYEEFKKQVAKVKKTGITITHLDSHQHIHMMPGVLKIVVRLMKEENIRYMRLPMEKLNIFTKIFDPFAWIRNILLSLTCRSAKKILDQSEILHNDYFIGHARALRLRKKDLLWAICNIKEGLTELGCHPGKRREEINALCEKDIAEEIKKHSIEIVSYATDDHR